MIIICKMSKQEERKRKKKDNLTLCQDHDFHGEKRYTTRKTREFPFGNKEGKKEDVRNHRQPSTWTMQDCILT